MRRYISIGIDIDHFVHKDLLDERNNICPNHVPYYLECSEVNRYRKNCTKYTSSARSKATVTEVCDVLALRHSFRKMLKSVYIPSMESITLGGLLQYIRHAKSYMGTHKNP